MYIVAGDINDLYKEDVSPLLMYWSYIYLVLTHRDKVPIFKTHLEKVCKSYVIKKM